MQHARVRNDTAGIQVLRPSRGGSGGHERLELGVLTARLCVAQLLGSKHDGMLERVVSPHQLLFRGEEQDIKAVHHKDDSATRQACHMLQESCHSVDPELNLRDIKKEETSQRAS